MLSFDWDGERHFVPPDPKLTRDEDEQWRAKLGFPPRSQVPSLTRSLARLPYPISAVEPFDDGWLVGVNQGEWGGALYFVDADNKPTELDPSGSVQAIFPTSTGAIVLFGLGHMGANVGYYRVVSPSDDGPKLGPEQKLQGTTYYIATQGRNTFISDFAVPGYKPSWAFVFDENGARSRVRARPVCSVTDVKN